MVGVHEPLTSHANLLVCHLELYATSTFFSGHFTPMCGKEYDSNPPESRGKLLLLHCSHHAIVSTYSINPKEQHW